MKRLLNIMLVASICYIMIIRAYSCAFNIIQPPDRNVTEGDVVNLTCCVDGIRRLTYSWIKKLSNSDISLIKTSAMVTNGSLSCYTHMLPNITVNDSGRYVCEVKQELPFLCNLTGNGTLITVIAGTRKDEALSSDISLHLIITIVAVVLLLLIALCSFCFVRLKRDQAARVIYEVPHFDSEEVQMEKHGTSSSGSTEWHEVPCYDSLDYFDHVQK